MSERSRLRIIVIWVVSGFVALAGIVYAVFAWEYLTTPHFEGLYDLPRSAQTLHGWLRIQSAFVGHFVLAGLVGGFAGLVGGLAVARVGAAPPN